MLKCYYVRLFLLRMTHPSGYSNKLGLPSTYRPMSVHWKVTCMLVISLRGRKGRFWSHVGSLGKRANIFLPAKNCSSKGKRRHTDGLRAWSPFQGRPPYNLHYLLFSGIGALLCHHSYCFPSQSQTLFGIGAGRPPLGQYCSDKHPCEFPLVTSIPLTF